MTKSRKKKTPFSSRGLTYPSMNYAKRQERYRPDDSTGIFYPPSWDYIIIGIPRKRVLHMGDIHANIEISRDEYGVYLEAVAQYIEYYNLLLVDHSIDRGIFAFVGMPLYSNEYLQGLYNLCVEISRNLNRGIPVSLNGQTEIINGYENTQKEQRNRPAKRQQKEKQRRKSHPKNSVRAKRGVQRELQRV